MAKKSESGSLDTRALLEAMSKDTHYRREDKPPEPEIEPGQVAGGTTPRPGRRRIGGFMETFFAPVESGPLKSIHISAATHERLHRIVGNLGGPDASLRGYIENILQRHLTKYTNEVNELYAAEVQRRFAESREKKLL